MLGKSTAEFVLVALAIQLVIFFTFQTDRPEKGDRAYRPFPGHVVAAHRASDAQPLALSASSGMLDTSTKLNVADLEKSPFED